MVSVKSLFPTRVLLKSKFRFGEIQSPFLILFIMKENNLIVDIMHLELC